MLEPMTLPTVMPGFPSKAARTDAMISGAEVPIETMVKPTITGGMEALMAKPDAKRTKPSPLRTNNTSPAIRNRMPIQELGLSVTSSSEATSGEFDA